MPLVKYLEQKLMCLWIRGKVGLEAIKFMDIKERLELAPHPKREGVIFRMYRVRGWRKGMPTQVMIFYNNYVPPSNPRTEKQQAWRENMKHAVLAWHSLPYEEKKEWDKLGGRKAWSVQDKYKITQGIPGFCYFVSCYLRTISGRELA